MKIINKPNPFVLRNIQSEQQFSSSGDDGGSEIVDRVVELSVPVVGLGAGVAAACFAAKLVEYGSGGAMNALTGTVVGAVAGGVTGILIDKLFGGDSDAAGNGMMAGALFFGGVAGGGAAGGVSGALGAQPWVTAPAFVAASVAGMTGAGYLRDFLLGE